MMLMAKRKWGGGGGLLCFIMFLSLTATARDEVSTFSRGTTQGSHKTELQGYVSYVQRIAKLSSLIYNHSTFVDLADTSSAPKSLKDT